jgi:hypothetical protein
MPPEIDGSINWKMQARLWEQIARHRDRKAKIAESALRVIRSGVVQCERVSDRKIARAALAWKTICLECGCEMDDPVYCELEWEHECEKCWREGMDDD